MTPRTILIEVTAFCSVTIEDTDHRAEMSDADVQAMEESNFRDDPMDYFANCNEHNIKVDVVRDDTTSVQPVIPGLEMSDGV
jgi:hypothetical protein